MPKPLGGLSNLHARKATITRDVIISGWLPLGFAVVTHSYRIVRNDTNLYLYSVLVLLTIAGTLSYIGLVRVINTRNYQIFLRLGVLFNILFSSIILILGGSTQPISWLIISTTVIGGVVILGIGRMFRYVVLWTFITLMIVFTHNTYFSIPYQDTIDSSLLNTLMLSILLWINVRIAKLGFSEIEYSYEKALEYAGQLEELNKDLEYRVNERTRQMLEDFEKRIEIYEREAEIGYIVKTLIHDIRTPLSSISLSINMLEDDSERNFTAIENSFKQLSEIVDQTEELILGSSEPAYFPVKESINSAIELISYQLARASITVDLEFGRYADIQLYGQRSIFLRIVLNLIVNSMEELKNNHIKDPQIAIKCYIDRKRLIVEVKDNGEGLSDEELINLFNRDYSTKYSGKHYGLGLHFVQRNMKEYYNGYAEVESGNGEFTIVRLIFELEVHDKP